MLASAPPTEAGSSTPTCFSAGSNLSNRRASSTAPVSACPKFTVWPRESVMQNRRHDRFAEATRRAVLDSIRALMLIRSYRVRGHLEAKLDPLGLVHPVPHPELFSQARPGDTLSVDDGRLGFEVVTAGPTELEARALGAGRLRLFQQLLTESLLLALACVPRRRRE